MKLDMEIAIRKPRECPDAELQEFIALVTSGGEVESKGLRGRVRDSAALVFAMIDGGVCGVAALKSPAKSYRGSIEGKSGAALPIVTFPYELGWIFIKPSARGLGISRELVKAALSVSQGSGLYATCRSNNTRMHRTLQRFGFAPTGKTYPSERKGHLLKLFTRLPTDAL